MKVPTLAEALEDSKKYSKRHLLLGNGFSIACRPNIFAYGRLFEQADFTKVSPTAKYAFTALGTQDFERVIKALRDPLRSLTRTVMQVSLRPGVKMLTNFENSWSKRSLRVILRGRES